MELHSYAKRRPAVKKWTINQKRQLVEARIKYDGIFKNMPTNSVLPWRKIVIFAKLDDYNVFFVRKQWSNMVARYKQYKQSRLGNMPSRLMNNDLIDKITQEWEFFRAIHTFMARKTTNLHSYAQMEPHQPPSNHNNNNDDDNSKDNGPPSQQPLNSNSSTERINIFSSDTNEDYDAAKAPSEAAAFPIKNTDHDFYSKKSVNQMNYFADASEDTQDTVQLEAMLNLPKEESQSHNTTHEMIVDTEQIVASSSAKMPATVTSSKTRRRQASPDARDRPSGSGGTRQLSERDKYYRHKRRFNRRLEKRFDCLLNVVGQIVKAEYPNVNVTPLVDLASEGSKVMNSLLNSDSSDNSSSSTDSDSDGNAHQRGRLREDVKKPKHGPAS